MRNFTVVILGILCAAGLVSRVLMAMDVSIKGAHLLQVHIRHNYIIDPYLSVMIADEWL